MREVKQVQKKQFPEKLDSVIGILFPAWEFKRRMARAANDYARKMFASSGGYKGASKDRLRSSWLPGGGSADEDLLPDLPDLRERSRDLERNDDIASGVVATMASNIVGTGIVPQSNIDWERLGISEDQAEKLENEQELIWDKWEPFADAAERMSFWEIQNLVERQMLINGEVIAVREMIDEPHRPYNLALNLVESDRLETPSDFRSNKNIRDGIELGSRGQPVAYWIKKTHPGDITYSVTSRSSSKENYIRYPVRDQYGNLNVFHLYWVKRPGQSRGIPFFAPVLNRFKNLAGYMEAEEVAQRVAACFALFIKKADPYNAAINRSDSTSGTKRLEEIEPGMLEYLGPGEDIASVNPARNGAQIDAYIEKVLRFIGAGLNLPYELVLKDFSKSNFSASRAAILEARRMFRQEQIWMSKKLCQPVWMMLMDEAYLRGEFEAADYWVKRHEYTRARWIGSGWAYIEPEKEIDASVTAVDNHLSTLADEAAGRGKDYEEILKQASREKRQMDKLGLKKPDAKPANDPKDALNDADEAGKDPDEMDDPNKQEGGNEEN